MPFQALAMSDIDFLAGVCGPERVCPELPERVRVAVASADEIARIMTYAFERGLPVSQGGRPGWLRPEAAPADGVILDLSAMNRVLELDREHFALTVEPGVLLAEIAGLVEARDCYYPWDPAETTATIAGQINADLGASKRRKDGATRSHILGLEVVLPNGEVMVLGGKDPRTSSGQALKDLIVGSGGGLGIVTRAILKLAPLPRKALKLLVPFPGMDKAMEAVARIVKTRTIPTAIEYMLKDVLLASDQGLGAEYRDRLAEVYLLLTFDGDTHRNLDAAHEQVSRLCLETGALDVLRFASEEQRDEIWKSRAACRETIRTALTPEAVALGA